MAAIAERNRRIWLNRPRGLTAREIMARRPPAALASFLSVLVLALGGAASAPAAECNGDECQGPPPAPEEVIPGTAIVQGPSNPPVRFPAHHHKKHKKQQAKKHRSQGRR
jgi:hypothetical protein